MSLRCNQSSFFTLNILIKCSITSHSVIWTKWKRWFLNNWLCSNDTLLRWCLNIVKKQNDIILLFGWQLFLRSTNIIHTMMTTEKTVIKVNEDRALPSWIYLAFPGNRSIYQHCILYFVINHIWCVIFIFQQPRTCIACLHSQYIHWNKIHGL